VGITVGSREVPGRNACDKRHPYNNNNNNNNNGELNMCYVEAKGTTSDPDSNIVYGNNSKVTITKSNKT